MKKSIIIFTISLISLLIPQLSSAYSFAPLAVVFYRYYTMGPEVSIDDEGRRVPTRPLQCTIDPENGVTIPLVDKAEIELYEIYSEDEVCIIATPVEAEFIDTLFSLTGTLEIRISTTEYIYAGYVNI